MIEGFKNLLQNQSEAIFLIDDKSGNEYTYHSFYHAACHIAGYLDSMGLKKGDCLAVMMDNAIFVAQLYFAALYAGITIVPINPGSTREQIDYICQDSHARILLTTENYTAKISTAMRLIVVNDALETVMLNARAIQPNVHLSAENTALIIYTSGTTSAPKGVIHSVADLVGNGLVFVRAMQMKESHRFFNCLPMTYLGGYYNLLLIPYLAKGSVVIADAFNAQTILRFWQKIIKHQVNTLWVVPTMMAILLEIDRSEKASNYCKQHVSLALVGTAPLPASLKTDFENRYHLTLYENYGLSETLFITAQTPLVARKGVGKLIENVAIRLVDQDGKEVNQGEEGEVMVKTPYVMNRYLSADNAAFIKGKDEWFHTGDIACLDGDGILTITGRKKDLIIKGGVNISPAAIEDVFYRYDAVQECAVVGIPHPLSGEEIIAVVKLNDNANFDLLKPLLLQACQQFLSVNQQPAEIVTIDELPHTYTGKIQKEKLRGWLINRKAEKYSKMVRQEKAAFYKPSHLSDACIEAISIVYNNKVYELQNQGTEVTVLSLGEAFFDLPLYDFKKLPNPASYHYSHSRGVMVLRKVLADYFLRQYSVSFDPEKEIIITAGSKIAIYMALMAIINPGDEVIIHDPAWVSYPEQVKLCHGVPVQVPYHESVYDFEKYITNRTKVLIVNNPNNPRGSVLCIDEIAHLYKLAEKYNLYILSDEAYSDFVENQAQFVSIGNFDKELKFSIICNSISKNFGISGWRIGYVIANDKLIKQILKLNQHLITCAPTVLTYYIATHFDDVLKVTKPQIASLLKKRRDVVQYINEIGLNCLEGDATFYLFLSIEGTRLSSHEFCTALLDKHRISVVPGIGYGKSCDGYVRVSIGTESLDKIYRALDTIKTFIAATSNVHHIEKVNAEQKAKFASV